MKTAVLFLLLAGVLTARAKTLANDNAELTEEDLDSLISLKEERELTGELDDDEMDLESLNSKMEERELQDDLDNDDVDFGNLKSEMEERALTGDDDLINLKSGKGDDGVIDLDNQNSSTEERALKDDATVAHASNVARRGLRCGRIRGRYTCEMCVRYETFRGCVGGQKVHNRLIILYAKLGTRVVWALRVTRTSPRPIRLRSGRVIIYIYPIVVTSTYRYYCFHFRYYLTSRHYRRTGNFCHRL